MTQPGGVAVVFVGAATYDAIALVDHFPGPDERLVADDVVFAGGGPAATAAVACSRLGVPAALVSAVGSDGEGDQIRESLRSEGVDVAGIEVHPQRRSGTSVVVVDAARGTRAICTRPVPPLHIETMCPAGTSRGRPGWVHVDHLGWEALQRWLTREGPGATPRVSVDAGNPVEGFSPAGVDLYVPTVESLVRRYGPLGVPDLLDAAIRDGASTVVATRGGDGAVCATGLGRHLTSPGHQVDVVSTLGAGDVFHGALLAAVVREMPLEECLRYANTAAALSCRGLDGRCAIPTHDEVLDTVNEHRTTQDSTTQDSTTRDSTDPDTLTLRPQENR